jgi:hypothetical protein
LNDITPTLWLEAEELTNENELAIGKLIEQERMSHRPLGVDEDEESAFGWLALAIISVNYTFINTPRSYFQHVPLHERNYPQSYHNNNK